MDIIGSISFEWVEPRFVSSKSRGKLMADETGAFFDALESQFSGEPYFLWEVDVSELDGMEPAARRICAERLQRLPDRAIAVVGGSFAEKVLTKLVLTAVAILEKSTRNNQVSFFDDSESARIWLRNYGATYRPVTSPI